MKEIKKEAIASLAEEKGGYFTASDLKEVGLNAYDINVLLVEDIIERLKRGFYRWTLAPYDEIAEAMRLVPDGVLCLFPHLLGMN